MKTAVLDCISDLPGLVDVSVYCRKPVHCILVCFNTIKWFYKKRQVYNPKKQMVRDAQFLHFNMNYSYNYKMNSVGLRDYFWNLYQVNHWLCKYTWWWSLLFLVHGLVLANAYIIYKTICE